MTVIKNVRPIVGGKLKKLSDIYINKGKVTAVKPHDSTVEGIDMNGAICASGYIDLHTHGGNGHDVMEGTFEAIDQISKYHLSTGTTTYAPTTLTADIKTTIMAIENVKKYKANNTARRLGLHLEGPFISKKTPGAHPPAYILDPSQDNTGWVWKYKKFISRVTLAPDNRGAMWFTEQCINNNIQVSIGHDASIDDEIYATIEKGASSVTHFSNCTSRPSRRTSPHKHLGLTEVGLISDKLVCELITDKRHVHNDYAKVIIEVKGRDGICLVSDSLAVAGVESGELYLGSGESKQLIKVIDGVAILPHLNTYAGSVTPIAELVTNLVENVGISLVDCVVMGTLVPARLMKLKDRGDIKKGQLADLNILKDNGEVMHTFLGGEQVK